MEYLAYSAREALSNQCHAFQRCNRRRCSQQCIGRTPRYLQTMKIMRKSGFWLKAAGAMAAADAPLQRTSVDFACGRRFASPGRREPPVPLPAVALDASAPFGAPDLPTDRRCERGPAAAGDILAYETELGALLLIAERSLQLIGVSFRRVPSRTSGTSPSSVVDTAYRSALDPAPLLPPAPLARATLARLSCPSGGNCCFATSPQSSLQRSRVPALQ